MFTIREQPKPGEDWLPRAMNDLLERLRAARTSKSITLRDLAKRLDVAASTLHAYEQGDRPVTLDFLSRWVDALDLKLGFTLGAESDGLLSLLPALSERDVRLLEAQAKAMAATPVKEM